MDVSARGASFVDLLVRVATVRDAFVCAHVRSGTPKDAGGPAADQYLPRMTLLREHAWDDALAREEELVKAVGSSGTDTKWLRTDATRKAVRVLNALKPFLGALPATDAVCSVGGKVQPPHETDDTRCWELLLRAVGRTCDTAVGAGASADVAGSATLQHTPWRSALLEHRFLLDSALALRVPPVAGTATAAAAHKPPVAVGSKRPRGGTAVEEDKAGPPASAFAVLLWLTMQVQLLRWEAEEEATPRTRGGGQPGATEGKVTAPGLEKAAAQLRDLRASRGEVAASRTLAQGTANVVSAVVEAWDELARKLRYASVEDMLLPFLTWHPDTLMVCAVEVPAHRDDPQPYAPLAQRKRLFGSATRLTTDPAKLDERLPTYTAVEAYQLGRAASTFVRHLVSCTDAKEEFGGSEASTHHSDTKLSIKKHVSVGTGVMSAVRRSLTAFPRAVAARPVAGVASSDAPAESSLQDEAAACADADDAVAGPASSPRPAPDVVAAHQVLDVLTPLLCTYDCGFEEFLSTHKQAQQAWPLDGTVQLVLTDPPYNLFELPHDRISAEQMKQTAELIGRLVRPGGHVVIFCAADQIGAWGLLLRRVMQPGTNTPVFMVDGAPLVVTRHPNYQTGYAQGRSTTSLSNCAEFAVHATANGAGLAGFASVNYRNHGFLQSRYKGTHNVLENVRKATPSEIVYVSAPKTDKKKRSVTMLRPQQKPLALLQELIARFSQPQDTVVDLFAGTFSTAAACATMPGGLFRRFVGCEVDAECAELALVSLARTVAPLVREGRFDAFLNLPGGTSNLKRNASKLLPVTTTAARAGKRPAGGAVMSETAAPPKVCKWTSLPEKLQLFLRGLLPPPPPTGTDADQAGGVNSQDAPPNVPDLTYLCGSVGTWPSAQQAALAAIDHPVLLASQAASAKVAVVDAGYGRVKVVALKDLNKGYILPALGAFVFRDLSSAPSASKPYGQGPLLTTPADFRERAVQLPATVSWWTAVSTPSQTTLGTDDAKAASKQPMWLVPPPWALCACVRDPRDVQAADAADRLRAPARGVSPPPPTTAEPNMRYKVQHGALHKPTATDAPDLVYLRPDRDIAAGEELLADRGPQYKPPVILTPDEEQLGLRNSPFGLSPAPGGNAGPAGKRPY